LALLLVHVDLDSPAPGMVIQEFKHSAQRLCIE